MQHCAPLVQACVFRHGFALPTLAFIDIPEETPMKRILPVALLALAAPAWAQDPVQTDGDKYHVVLDNDRVRVLRYQDQPGERTHQHRHPAFVVVALAPFQRKLMLADGRTASRAFQAGDAMYSAGETHIGENVGGTPTQVLMVELKDTKDGAGCPTGR
jgi:beta-alanine degradation protein BauB